MMLAGEFDRLGLTAGNADHFMAERFDDAGDIHRDHRLVLDDQHPRGRLAAQLLARDLELLHDIRLIQIQDPRGFARGEALQGNQQENLPLDRRQRRQLPVQAVIGFGFAIRQGDGAVDDVPGIVEDGEQLDTQIGRALDPVGLGKDRLQAEPDVLIAGLL